MQRISISKYCSGIWKFLKSEDIRGWLIVIITGILAWYSYGLYSKTAQSTELMDKSVRITDSTLNFARKNANIENRAWIGLNATPDIMGYLDEGSIQITIKNFGKTPPDSVRTGGNIFTKVSPSRPNIVLNTQNTIPPTGTLTFKIPVRLDSSTINKIKFYKSRVYVCIYGIIVYKDIGGNYDTTEFMYKYRNFDGETVPFGINRMK
jgi:hypothetical protein